ncbi:MAG: BrnT family toxin [Rhodobacteraceae bacterium]|nr:BrnT family toxin [Paracoccaceae bacterium]
MSGVRFTWDEAKNLSNQKKHDGIGFEIAAHVFNDPLRLMLQDRIKAGEERWQTLGVVHGLTVLLVAHTIFETTEGRDPVEVIRLISARRATRKERKRYEQEKS